MWKRTKTLTKSRGQTFVEYILIAAFIGLVMAVASAHMFEGVKTNFWYGLQSTNTPRKNMPPPPDGSAISSKTPSAIISGPSNLHVGDVGVYYDQSVDYDGRIVRNSWGARSIEKKFLSEGQQTITLTVWDNDGLSATVTKVVTVGNAAPNAVITLNPETGIVEQKNVVVSAANSNDPDGDQIVLYEWTLDGQKQPNWDKEATTTFTPGSHTLTLRVRDKLGKWSNVESKTFSVRVNTKPTANITINPSYIHDKKTVTFSTAGSTDPEGDTIVNEEWAGDKRTQYPVGTYTVKLRVQDQFGLWSDWTQKTFTVNANRPPSTPVITKNPSGNVSTDTNVTITASSTDPDGDSVTYRWTGRIAETSKYPAGRREISVVAVDQYGAESSPAGLTFYVLSPNGTGGVTLTNSGTTIIENVPEGATAKSYTFNVPAVSGHSGSDYGRVQAYNKNTGQWVQIEKRSVSNGIYMTGNLTPGIYSKVEFYYYTNHTCMYGSSNITYSVDYAYD